MVTQYIYGEDYIKGKQEVFTTGFPRCGNTWLDRILSDALRAPLQPKPEEPIEYFGPSPHDGPYVVRKTHFYAHQYSGIGYSKKPAKMVWIQRDPRDMAVSVMFYRRVQPDMMSVLKSVFQNQHIPGVPVIGYRWFMEGWLDSISCTVATRYEALQENGPRELRRIYKAVTGKRLSKEESEEVIHRQRFDRWKSRYPHSMRKGVSGDWHDWFNRKYGAYLTGCVGDIMLSQGYIDDMDWWKELPERLPNE